MQRPSHRLQQTPALRLQPLLEVGRVLEPHALQQIAAPQRPGVALPTLRGATLELDDVRPDEPVLHEHLVLRCRDDRLAAETLVHQGHGLRKRVPGETGAVLGPEQVHQTIARLRLTGPAHEQGEESQLLACAEGHPLTPRTAQAHGAEAAELELPWRALAGRTHLALPGRGRVMASAVRHLRVTSLAASASEIASPPDAIVSRSLALTTRSAARSRLRSFPRHRTARAAAGNGMHGPSPAKPRGYRVDATGMVLYDRPTNQ